MNDRQRLERDRQRCPKYGPARTLFGQVDAGQHHQAGHDERRLTVARAGKCWRQRGERQDRERRVALSSFSDSAEPTDANRETADRNKPPGDLTGGRRQPGERGKQDGCERQIKEAVSSLCIDVPTGKPLKRRVSIR
jgi:hypothetical protein